MKNIGKHPNEKTSVRHHDELRQSNQIKKEIRALKVGL